MGHQIAGIILSTGMLKNALALFSGTKAVTLPQEFSILPINADLIDGNGDKSRVIYPFDLLTENLAKIAQDYSADCGIAYIETEYFGGVGAQCAIAWINSCIVYGPEISRTEWIHDRELFTRSNGFPINQALQEIGVEKEKGEDEFDSLRLGNFRSFEDYYDISN
ncbi:hypothetical protein MLD52_22415 [Puniceicoccaceae bacterium K14]|nr:hypothetical protein [Puniceicoccaceae bacterium K14]